MDIIKNLSMTFYYLKIKPQALTMDYGALHDSVQMPRIYLGSPAMVLKTHVQCKGAWLETGPRFTEESSYTERKYTMRFRNLRVFWKELEKYIVYLQQL
jgi:hypothetical protein